MRAALLAALLLAAPAAAQAPDVAGVWELASSTGVPVDDVLVFARVTITDAEVDAVYVFLDPDDGELAGRFEDARYVVSNGQLVLRDGHSTTVWAVARDGTFLTVRDLETGVTLVLREAAPGSDRDPALLGAWTGTRGGEPFAVAFRPDGTATVRRGDDVDTGRYTVAGAYVLLGDEPARYALRRAPDGAPRLVVEADREVSVLAPADDGPPAAR